MKYIEFYEDSSGRKWYHKSVLELIKQYSLKEDPENIIRKRAINLVNEGLQYGWSGPPFDPKILASLKGIKVEKGPPTFKEEAMIFPRGDQQLIILYNPFSPPTRINFSICHELTHTLFPNYYETIKLRSKKRQKFDPNKEIEYLCDIGASEILMPAEFFKKDLKKYGLSLYSVEPLRQIYLASYEAVIRRMIDLADINCAAVFFEFKLKPKEINSAKQITFDFFESPKPKMRVSYAITSKNFPFFIPKDKSAPDNSCIYKAVITQSIESDIEKWEIKNFGFCRIEAMPIPPNLPQSPKRIVALVFPLN